MQWPLFKFIKTYYKLQDFLSWVHCTNNMVIPTQHTHYLYLIVHFLVCFGSISGKFGWAMVMFWQDAVEPKYLWRDQTSQICCRSVTLRYDLVFTITKFQPKNLVIFWELRLRCLSVWMCQHSSANIVQLESAWKLKPVNTSKIKITRFKTSFQFILW